MLSARLFEALVGAAAQAPSADNMQAWEFARRGDEIDVFAVRRRVLPTDCGGMFAWIGLGAALENLVLVAAREGLTARVGYEPAPRADERAAVVRLAPGATDGRLADCIEKRATNRRPYDPAPLESALLTRLTAEARGLDAGVHWATGPAALARMAQLEARSTYIRLEHKPLHDEVFEVLRFTRGHVETTRYGLDFRTLETPGVIVFLASLLRRWSVNAVVARLGIHRLVARLLASRVRQAGALALITARRRDPAGYMEAGRALQRVWLAGTALGLAAQPFGALPQYLTKEAVEPAFFERHAAVIAGHRGPFWSIFPGARDEHPAIVLRVGHARGEPTCRSVRLKPAELIRAA